MMTNTQKPENTGIENFSNNDRNKKRENFIAQNPQLHRLRMPPVMNATPKDFTYNSYADDRNPTFNQWTRIHDDDCEEANRLRLASKPMKYYVNQFNSPQTDPFIEYTIIGNQKPYAVRNEYERPIPSRLNPVYPV
jgi:hypothetical protein